MNERDGSSQRIEAIRGSVMEIFLRRARAHRPELERIDELRLQDPGSVFKLYKQVLDALPDQLVLLLEPPANPIMTDVEREAAVAADVVNFFEHLYHNPSCLNVAVDYTVLYLNRVPDLIMTNVLANQGRGCRVETTPEGKIAVVIPNKARG